MLRYIVIRHMRCGKAACRCKADPPTLHGPWFDNARRLRDLVSKLEAASLLAMETAEGWTDKP